MRDDLLSVIWPLLGRHIAFHRRLVDLTDGVKPALLLSQSIYWTRHGVDIERNGGWFHKTAQQWELETGLSLREQATARSILRSVGLLLERRLGIPGTLHFRVNLEALTRRLNDHFAGHAWADEFTSSQDDPGRQDSRALTQLLGPAVAFHRALAVVAGGVHAGLMLSRALYQTRKQLHRQGDPWVACSAQVWWEDLGLTRREHESARRMLSGAGLWQDCLAGRPPVLLIRVRLDQLLHRLSGSAGDPTSSFNADDFPECGVPSFQSAPNVDSCLRESHSHVLRKRPSHIQQNRHSRFDESAIPLKVLSTSDSVQIQTPRTREALACGQLRSGNGHCPAELIFPAQLLPAEREAARRMLIQTGADPQVLLDELAGRLNTTVGIHSPLGYLRGLIQRANAGTFVPDAAAHIQADRQARDAYGQPASSRLCESSPAKTGSGEQSSSAHAQAQRDKARQRLAELRSRLSERLAG